MRKQLDKELENLYYQLKELGLMVVEALENAQTAFVKHDLKLSEQVISNDRFINAKEITIENECAKLIALQQPVVSDLRKIISIMKVCADLERMGDHARSIARNTVQLKESRLIPEIEAKLNDMTKIVIEMAKRSLRAYIREDDKEAREIVALDKQVDNYLLEITRLAIEEMKANPKLVFNGSGYLSSASHIERIGDYVKNICEKIVYIKTGEIIELH